MPVDPLDFGPDLAATQERVRLLGVFLLVGDVALAADAMEGRVPFKPPAAFVAVANEQAEPNRIAAGGYSQRVGVRVSVVFCIKTERAAKDTRDQMERTRKAIMRQLVNWSPPGSDAPFAYDRYLIRRTGAGLCWGEVLFLTSYRFSQ